MAGLHFYCSLELVTKVNIEDVRRGRGRLQNISDKLWVYAVEHVTGITSNG